MLSLPKILLLVLVVGIAWYGYKIFGPRIRKALDQHGEPPAVPSVDMQHCPICGTYVSIVSPGNCGRDNCPYPGLGQP